MLAIRNLLRPSTHIVKNVAQKRAMSVIAVPPRKNVSKGEIVFLSCVMVAGWTAIPAWVVCNIKNYREKK